MAEASLTLCEGPFIRAEYLWEQAPFTQADRVIAHPPFRFMSAAHPLCTWEDVPPTKEHFYAHIIHPIMGNDRVIEGLYERLCPIIGPHKRASSPWVRRQSITDSVMNRSQDTEVSPK